MELTAHAHTGIGRAHFGSDNVPVARRLRWRPRAHRIITGAQSGTLSERKLWLVWENISVSDHRPGAGIGGREQAGCYRYAFHDRLPNLQIATPSAN
jgi:hypothetical protein